MEAPIKVVVEMINGAAITGHLDFGAECDDAKLPMHNTSVPRPVVVPIDDSPYKGEHYCLGCWVDDDQSVTILIGSEVW